MGFEDSPHKVKLFIPPLGEIKVVHIREFLALTSKPRFEFARLTKLAMKNITPFVNLQNLKSVSGLWAAIYNEYLRKQDGVNIASLLLPTEPIEIRRLAVDQPIEHDCLCAAKDFHLPKNVVNVHAFNGTREWIPPPELFDLPVSTQFPLLDILALREMHPSRNEPTYKQAVEGLDSEYWEVAFGKERKNPVKI